MSRNKGKYFLLLAAAIWACGLVSQKYCSDYIGPLTFTAIRCTMGGLMLLPAVRIFEKKEKTKDDIKFELKSGIICGFALVCGILLQQFGLPYTTVGKAGFISALYILLTPILGMFVKKPCPAKIWMCIAIALMGMYLLCLYDGIEKFSLGDGLMLLSALFYALQVQVIDRYVGKILPVTLSCYQFLACGLICIIPAIIFEHDTVSLEAILGCWFPILYSGLISCGLGYTFQTIGQKSVEPNKASLLLSSETVFTLFAGMIFFHETLSLHEYLGCALMLGAIIMSIAGKKG